MGPWVFIGYIGIYEVRNDHVTTLRAEGRQVFVDGWGSLGFVLENPKP